MVNAKFLPCVSDEMKVLKKLTEKNAEWCWLTAHEEAVVRIQRMLSTAPYIFGKRDVVVESDHKALEPI
jgi:hypothetical protein